MRSSRAFDDRYRSVFGRRDVLFMNAEDMAGEPIEVHAAAEEGEEPDASAALKPVTLVAYDIPKALRAPDTPRRMC
ncbi:MAG: hypothetical protein V4573_07920 [Pseudomonadota bacterium]